MLEGFEALGNAGVVPIVIFFTQVIKKRIARFRYRSDLLALILSLVLCIGWTFYYMSTTDFNTLVAADFLVKFRWGVDQLIVGVATWFSASKIYDLGHGQKKRERQHLEEKEMLTEEIVKLKKNGNGDTNDQSEEDPVVADKLRTILEG